MKYNSVVDMIDALDKGVPLSYVLDNCSVSISERAVVNERWFEYISYTIKETGNHPPQRTMDVLPEELFEV